MFHVKPPMFIRIDMRVEGATTPTHIAELFESDNGMCEMGRVIELADTQSITGAAHQGTVINMLNMPQQTVPHPSTYGDFPDIDTSVLSEDEFEALWREAVLKFPDLNNV